MRVKRGLAAHRRHKKYLDMAKGFRGGRSRLYRTAREAVERSLAYAFVGRKQRKREFRKLWILRINAGARENGLLFFSGSDHHETEDRGRGGMVLPREPKDEADLVRLLPSAGLLPDILLEFFPVKPEK